MVAALSQSSASRCAWACQATLMTEPPRLSWGLRPLRALGAPGFRGHIPVVDPLISSTASILKV